MGSATSAGPPSEGLRRALYCLLVGASAWNLGPTGSQDLSFKGIYTESLTLRGLLSVTLEALINVRTILE